MFDSLRTEYDDYCNLSSRRRFLKEVNATESEEGEMSYSSESVGIRRQLSSSGSTTAKIYIYPISEFEKDTTTPNI